MVNPSPQHNKGSGANAAVSGSASSSSASSSSAISNAEAELLQSVLASEAYPWTVEEAESYAEEIDSVGRSLEISDEEATKGWQALSAQLTQIWSEDVETEPSALYQTFAGRLPADLLDRIIQKAKQVSASGESMVNQMVVCAQEVLSGMADADLQVMARPMAMAMRGRSSDEIVNVTIKSVRVAEWDALSPIEQAKLSLAASRYALSETERR